MMRRIIGTVPRARKLSATNVALLAKGGGRGRPNGRVLHVLVGSCLLAACIGCVIGCGSAVPPRRHSSAAGRRRLRLRHLPRLRQRRPPSRRPRSPQRRRRRPLRRCLPSRCHPRISCRDRCISASTAKFAPPSSTKPASNSCVAGIRRWVRASTSETRAGREAGASSPRATRRSRRRSKRSTTSTCDAYASRRTAHRPRAEDGLR